MANLLLGLVLKSMKSFMILGALVGFLIGAGVSLAGDCPWPTALWRAGVAALAMGILTRWWSGIWLQNLRSAVKQRRQASFSIPAKTKPVIK